MFKLDRIIPCPEGLHEYMKSRSATRTFEPGEPPSDFALDGSRSMVEASRYILREIERGNLPQQGIRNAHSFEHYASLYEYGVSPEVARALYEQFYDAGGLRPDEGDTKIERRIEDIWSGKADVGKPGSKLRPLASEIHDPIMVERAANRPQDNGNIQNGGDVMDREIEWLWDGWISLGKMHLLAGEPGTGKSTLLLSLLATITTGGVWPDGTRAPQGSVLVWSGEDNVEDTLMPRFRAMGGEPYGVNFVRGVSETDMNGNVTKRSFDPARDMPRLLQMARGIKDLKAIMIDPIVSAVTGDSHKNAEVRRSLAPLFDYAEESGIAVIGITHFTKGTAGRDPTSRVTGSLAFAAAARIVMAAAKSEDGSQRVLVRTKSNIGRDTDGFRYTLVRDDRNRQSVVWGEAALGTARELMDNIAPKPEPTGRPKKERSFAANWILDKLKDGPVTCGRIQQDMANAGIARATFFRALQELREWVETVPNERPNMDRAGDRECYRLKPTQGTE